MAGPVDIDSIPCLPDYTSTNLTAEESAHLSQFKEPIETGTEPVPQQYRVPHAGRECQAAAAASGLDGCMCVATATDHGFVSVGAMDGRISIFRPPDHKPATRELQELRAVYCLDTCATTTVNFGNVPGGAHAPSEPVAPGRKLPIAALAWRTPTPSAQNVLLAAQGACVVGHHATTGKQVSCAAIPPSAQGEENILSLAVSQSGAHVAVGGAHGSVHVFDGRGSALQHGLKFGQLQSNSGELSSSTGHGHTSRVFALHWHLTDDNVLFSGGWDNTVQMWDIRARRSVRSIFGPHLCGNGIAQIGTSLVTASWRTKDPLQLWDIGSGALVSSLPIHGADDMSPMKLYCVAVTRQGHLVTAGSSNRPGARVLTPYGQTVGTLHTPSAVYDVDVVSSEGKDFAIVCYGDTVAAVPV